MKRMLLVFAALPLLLLAPLTSFAAPTTLPDFTAIVQKYGNTVVNVRADITKPSPFLNGPQGQQGQAQVPDIFRFFGIPVPQQPTGPEEEISMGSGFIISPDGYILTNDHVVDGASKITVTLNDRKIYTAKLVGADAMYDIALLKINATNLPAVQIGNSSVLQPGQWVLAIGEPFGLTNTVTAGIISAVGRNLGRQDQPYTPFIQTDVPINRGNSGGPLFNMDGQVIGINSQIFSNTGGYMGVSFSIPINVAMDVVQQLKTKGYVTRGMIGVYIQPVTPGLAKGMGLERVEGALIARVEPDSPAQKAGLRSGDIILQFNGQPVYNATDLPAMVSLLPPGKVVPVVVMRDGKQQSFQVRIEAAPHGNSGMAQMERMLTGNSLGLTVRDLSAGERQQMDLKSGEGVEVTTATGPARGAGLQQGDVILQVGQQRVGSVAAFESAVKPYSKPGQVAVLLVRRGKFSQFVAVEIPRGKDAGR